MSSDTKSLRNTGKKIIKNPSNLLDKNLGNKLTITIVLKTAFIIFFALYFIKNYLVYTGPGFGTGLQMFAEILRDVTRVIGSTAATTGLITMLYHLKDND